MTPVTPSFDSAAFLRQHVDSILRFYEPRALDPRGGFYHYFKDDGHVYDREHRHLVSATRFVFNWAQAHRHTARQPYLQWTAHALAHVEQFKIQTGSQQGLYAWTVRSGVIEDATVFAYGQAFVLLAKAYAYTVGLCDAKDVLAAFEQMNEAFWCEADMAYADEISPKGVLMPYRGQNANMHICEACLSAYQATDDQRYWQRAQQLIERFAFDLASHAGGLVWEHYNSDWTPDWDYNRGKTDNIFKPWGFQTGHQTEWAKLILIAHQFEPQARYLQRAMELHHGAYTHGWDRTFGGLMYGFGLDHEPFDRHKYFWVQAESFASAWRLWKLTGDEVFLKHYKDIWQWSWQYLVDHTHGAWYRIVSPSGEKIEDTKSPAGKTDYHTMGACWDVMHCINEKPTHEAAQLLLHIQKEKARF